MHRRTPYQPQPVTVANEALTIGKDASEVRTTKILRSPSKLIKANPVKLAPTSPYNFVTATPNRIHKLPLTRQAFTFQLQSKVTAFNTFQTGLPSLTTLMPGAINLELSFSRLRRTIAAGLVETASKACASSNPNK